MWIDAKTEIKKLKDGEVWKWPESDYGRAEIWLKNGTYFLFAIPQYGGEPYFHDFYRAHNIDSLIKEVVSWT